MTDKPIPTGQVSEADIREMLAGLDGVTPGPWSEHEKGIHPHSYVCGPSEETEHGIDKFVVAYAVGLRSDKNKRHIARCDPDTMRQVLTLALSALETPSPSPDAGSDEPVAWVPRFDAVIAVAKRMAEHLGHRRPSDADAEKAATFLWNCIEKGALSPLAARLGPSPEVPPQGEAWTRDDLAEGIALLNGDDFGPQHFDAADDLLAHLSLAASQRQYALTPSTIPEPSDAEVERHAGIYVASKVAHAEMWRDFRHFEREPIISTWIDEAGAGESASLEDLWRRCVHEAATAGALIIYRRPDEVLKGAWVELGAALASGVPVFAVGIEGFTVANHAGITHCANLIEARKLARAALAAKSTGGER